jgi:hypothetical protein
MIRRRFDYMADFSYVQVKKPYYNLLTIVQIRISFRANESWFRPLTSRRLNHGDREVSFL